MPRSENDLCSYFSPLFNVLEAAPKSLLEKDQLVRVVRAPSHHPSA